MTILSAQTIRKLCTPHPSEDLQNFEGMITPFVERGVVCGKSYGLSSAGYDIRIGKLGKSDFDDGRSLRMQNGDFVLGSSYERFKIPNHLIAFVKDKSSWAREGLAVQNTVLEPGWEGYITLELSYHRPGHHVVLHLGDPIAQVIFQPLDYSTELPYKGKYQNQPDRPIEAIYEENGNVG
jgi:dCTP deaminase